PPFLRGGAAGAIIGRIFGEHPQDVLLQRAYFLWRERTSDHAVTVLLEAEGLVGHGSIVQSQAGVLGPPKEPAAECSGAQASLWWTQGHDGTRARDSPAQAPRHAQ